MTVHMPVVELRRFYYNRGVCLLIVRDPTKHTGRQLWVAFRTVPITSLKFYWDQPFLIGFTGWNFSYLGKKNGLIETVQRAFSWTCHVIVARVWTIPEVTSVSSENGWKSQLHQPKPVAVETADPELPWQKNIPWRRKKGNNHVVKLVILLFGTSFIFASLTKN